MNAHETFGQCLQRLLGEQGISASEAARLVQFRSRNSIFRILAGDTSSDVDARFLASLKGAVGGAWPQDCWTQLEEALDIKRVGRDQHFSNKAFFRTLHEPETELRHTVLRDEQEESLEALLQDLVHAPRVEIIVTGCCDAALSRILVRVCTEAGDAGRLSIRHYIDTADDVVVENILGVLPLVCKPWYNARVLDDKACPEEMMALYRVHSLILIQTDEKGEQSMHYLTCFAPGQFLYRIQLTGYAPIVSLLDRWRYRLELLKPIPTFDGAEDAFLSYTSSYERLEHNCTILSIKPDIHFNCVPCHLLEPSITQGIAQAGIADGEKLTHLMTQLYAIHDARYRNMATKRSATHLVYSLPAMERFMATGVQTDQFFIQRPYTPEERRAIMADLRDCMLSNPAFNVHFLKPEVPELRNEITYYKGKGVVLLDAYSHYAFPADHSEAHIAHPAFMNSFYAFFMDELLQKYVLPRQETLAELERLIRME